jgi:2-keto-3-deoxy-L-rhamnonate aldolase RhmA
MKPNKLRQLIKEGKPTLGVHSVIPWPRLVEIMAVTGAFDYIEYIGEYSTYDLETFENLARAIELYPNMSMMIKVEEQSRGYIATRALDAGIQNALFADIRSADDVRECVRFIRPETPEAGGRHGAASRRINVGSNAIEWVKQMNDAVLAFMIEKKSAMDNLEEILSVKGVDMVQFGPNDYSVSLGKPGQGGLPEVVEAHNKMIKMAIKAGVRPRVEISSPEEAKPYIEMGVKDFCMGWDHQIVAGWCRTNGPALRKLLP